MSWTVPSGCYYAVYEGSGFYYYGSGGSVPTSRAPNTNYDANVRWVLVDFTNGYIYNHILTSSRHPLYINIQTNNTFTAEIHPESGVLVSIDALVYIIGSDYCADSTYIVINGSFTFGNGTGMLSKSRLIGSSNIPYAMWNTFRNRTDLTNCTIPDGAEWFYYTFRACTNLQSVTQSTTTVQSAVGMFYGCTSLISAPNYTTLSPNGTESYSSPWTTPYANFSYCFVNCSSLTTAPIIPVGITSLKGCFRGCSSLTSASTIPSSVSDLTECFKNCVALVGAITINSNPSVVNDIFYGTVNEIVLLGSGGSNTTIASQYSNVFVWSLSSSIAAQRDESLLTSVDISVDVTRFNTGTLTSLSLYKNNGQTPLSVTWNDPTLTITGNPTTFTTTITGIAESDTPTISVIAKDAYGSAKKVSVNVPIAFYTMDVQAGGKEIAFGAIATDNLTNHPNGLFRCNMDTLLNGPLECNNNVKFNNAINPITVSNGLPPYYKITSTQIDLTESAPVSDTLHDQTIRHYDANGTRIGQIEVYRTTADVMGTAIQVARTVGGELVHNTIAMRIDANGNMGYTVGSPSAFRSAIGITRGTTTAITTPAGSYTDYSVTFGKTYSSNPTVIVGFVSSSTAGAFGRCSCSVHSITTTGCTVRVFNGDTTQRAPNVSWVAVGD